MTEIHSVRPLAAILLAFVAIAFVVLFRRRPRIRHAITVGAAVLTFGIVASLIQPVKQGQMPTTNLGTLVGTVDLSFQADPLGLIFALTVSGLWVVTAVFDILLRLKTQESRAVGVSGLQPRTPPLHGSSRLTQSS